MPGWTRLTHPTRGSAPPRGTLGEAGPPRPASLPSSSIESPLRCEERDVMSSPDPLSGLRDAIADVDRALLELLRRRMDLAAEVGRIKAVTDRPVVVRDVEDRVLTRARQYAEDCGVSEEVMEEMFQAIIRGSVERQYRVGIALREQRGGRVLIVGGAGGMGTWLRGFLELVGHSVEVVDPALG